MTHKMYNDFMCGA